MTGPEAGAIVGVSVTIAGFILGVVKIKGNRDPEAGKYVLKSDCELDRGSMKKSIGEMRDEQTKQGKMLARIDERTKRWAEKNGYDR